MTITGTITGIITGEESASATLAFRLSGAGTQRRVMRAAVSVTAAGTLVKLAATGKEIVVAAVYGRSDAMDAFLAAFLIPNLLINLVAESMNQALIPTLIRVRVQQGHARAQQLLSSSILATVGMLVFASAAMGLLARISFPLIAWNYSAIKIDLATRLFYMLLPCVVLGGIASNCTAVLNTVGRFGWPALTPTVVSLSTIVATLLFQGSFGMGALAIATVIGTALQAVLLAVGMYSNGYALQLRWSGDNEAAREVARQFGPVLLSSVVASAGLLVDQGMAAMLPAGSVSALVFAGRFISVAVTLLAGSLSTAVAPHLSELVARGDWALCRVTMRAWAGRSALISAPLAVVLMISAPVLVRITLQHGAFAASDTRIVASTLAMYAIQIPFFVVSRVFYRFVIAMRRTDLVFYCGGINLALDIVLNLVLMRSMGVAGIALATSLWTISTCALLWFWTYRLLSAAESAHV